MIKVKGHIRFRDLEPGTLFGVCVACGHVGEPDMSRFIPDMRIVEAESSLKCSVCGSRNSSYFRVTKYPSLKD